MEDIENAIQSHKWVHNALHFIDNKQQNTAIIE